jgi:hypothetical protein
MPSWMLAERALWPFATFRGVAAIRLFGLNLQRDAGMVLREPMSREHRQFYPRIGSFISESAARPFGP